LGIGNGIDILLADFVGAGFTNNIEFLLTIYLNPPPHN